MQYKHIFKNISVTLTGMFLSTHLYAAGFSLDEHDFLIDIPTVTSATRLTQHLSDAPVSMTVIDRATIQASGAQTVPDLLRLVPGFQVAHVNTNKYAVTYHGHSDDFPRRLEVMIDGRSVYIPIISAVDWSSLGLHLDDIERIEVARGSNTATYGSNAFMGAVNIITRHPSTDPLFSGSTTIGSLNNKNMNLRYSDTHSIGHYRISAYHEENTGSALFNDGARRSYLSFHGSFAPTLIDHLDVSLGADQGHIKIGELKPARGLPEDLFLPRRTYSSNYQHIQWQRLLSNRTRVGIQAYRNELQLQEQQANITELMKSGFSETNATILLNNNPSFRFLNEDGENQQQDVELFISHDGSPFSSYTGLGVRHSFANSATLFEQGKVKSTRYRVSNNTSFSPSKLYTLNLGILHEHEESGPDATSARAAMNLHVSEALTLRLGYSHSERLPSLLESYQSSTIYYNEPQKIIFEAVRRPSPNLNPERVKSNELGLLYNFHSLPGHLDLRVFSEHISRGIESYVVPFPERQLSGMDRNNPKVTTRVSQNISSWTNQGAEAQLKLQPHDNLWFMLNYAYINSTKDGYFDGSRTIIRRQLAPRHTGSAMISWNPRQDIHLSASHYFTDQMHWFGGDDRDAYHRTDLRMAKQWLPSATTHAEAALVIQNAFGPSYKEFYDYHDFERRVFLTFRLKYN